MVKRIDKLTPEQEQLLPEFRDKWLALGLAANTELDRERIRVLMKGVFLPAGDYRLGGVLEFDHITEEARQVID